MNRNVLEEQFYYEVLGHYTLEKIGYDLFKIITSLNVA
jgi:hypothetical protein